MSSDDTRATMVQEDLDISIEVKKSNGETPVTLTPIERLRSRVLDLLKAPDPVCGIYAMYGAHERHPQQCIPEK